MIDITATTEALREQGFDNETIIKMLCSIKMSADVAPEQVVRTARQERNARYYDRLKSSENRLKASESVLIKTLKVSDKEKFPHTPSKEINLPNSENNKSTRARGIDPEGFSDFWSHFPNREGNADRKSAVKAFNAALGRSSAAEIIAGAMRYAAHCDATQKTGTAYVRQARTWLNADGWNENYVLTRNSKPQPRSEQIKGALRAFVERRDGRTDQEAEFDLHHSASDHAA